MKHDRCHAHPVQSIEKCRARPSVSHGSLLVLRRTPYYGTLDCIKLQPESMHNKILATSARGMSKELLYY